MPVEQLIPLVGFVIAMVGTPGPNNLMLMAAGANFGFRRSLPHIFGITVGCQTLLLGVAVGLGQLFATYPAVVIGLKMLGGLFLVYLAFQLVRPASKKHQDGEQKVQASETSQPLTFTQAALFQWVNPKAWMMFLTAIATYADPEAFVASTLVIALLFAVLGFPLISAWNLGGVSLKSFLAQEGRLQAFNRIMAAVLLISLYPLLS